MKIRFILLFVLVFSIHLCANPKREIRAVWLTTNYGLDWPSEPLSNDFDIQKQKEDLDRILTKMQEVNINLVFLQTRLRGDVIYPSRIENVSSHVKSIHYHNRDYDMLDYAIEACHARGMECHAWFVTYPLGTKSIDQLSPELRNKKYLVKTFEGEKYLDPGHPETNAYLLSLIAELVSKYDIDGLHFDYIRYPDKSAKFPDESIYKQYGNRQTKADWRRDNINRFVYAAYDTVKSLKPWVQVSSSVVGMYTKIGNSRPHWTAYHDVYQDPVDWMEKGKHDFILPMMYYRDDLFFPFVEDWVSRSKGHFIVPGLGLYQMDKKELDWSSETILEQIRHSREKRTQGNAFYRVNFLLENEKGIFDEVKKIYSTPALLPSLTWLSDTIPSAPYGLEAVSQREEICFQWEEADNSSGAIYYNLYRSSEFPVDLENIENLVAARLTNKQFRIFLDNSIEAGYYYVVTSYDRFHNESEPSLPVYYVTGNFEK
jgi:Uncharacterized protein conserved in bacteria